MLSRSLLLSIALVALAALSALVGCGGGGAQVALAVSRSGELVDVVRSTLRARQSERQRGAGGAVGLAPASTVAQDSSTAAAPTRSTTLTQEEGVGESDLLLGDDTRLFTLQPGATRAEASVGASRRNADGSLTTLPNLVLTADVAATETGTAELQIDGLHASTDLQGLVATSQQWIATGNPCQGVVDCVGTPFPGAVWLRSQLALNWIEAARPEALRQAGRIAIDGQLVATRRLGNTLVVVSTYRPQLKVELLPWDAPASQRDALLAALTPADLLPTMRIDGGASQPLVKETDCWVQPANRSLDVVITTISLFDLTTPGAPRVSRCFVGGSEALYMSAANLYLATTRSEAVPAVNAIRFVPDFKTDVHKFAISATNVAYRASGMVVGHLGWQTQRRAWRFSESGNDLRLLTYTGPQGWITHRRCREHTGVAGHTDDPA